MSKVLNDLMAKHPEKISEIEDDRGDRNGWWIHLRCGWVCTLMETHSIHEDTVAECLKVWKSVKPCSDRFCSCDCDTCTKVKAMTR